MSNSRTVAGKIVLDRRWDARSNDRMRQQTADGPRGVKKQCRECSRLLDLSSFNGDSNQPDGMAKTCRACINRRRRQLHATRTHDDKPDHLGSLVKKGDYAAVSRKRARINAANRDRLLALAVTDFKSAPRKPGHVRLVKLLIRLGAKPDFHLVCAASVGPHVDIMNALIEGGAEQNIFTDAAFGDAKRLRQLLARDPTLAAKTTTCGLLREKDMTALNYACRSELGKISTTHADALICCAELLLARMPPRLLRTSNPLLLCAARGGSVAIARLLIAHGCQPNVTTLLAALGHGQRHGRGNYEIAELCLKSGVDINEPIGNRSLLHAFAHQGDIIGTRWLVDHGAAIDAKDVGNDTPLHKACERNSTVKVVELLVECGASLKSLNNNGETPLDVAIKNDKKAIAAYLNRIGANSARLNKAAKNKRASASGRK